MKLTLNFLSPYCCSDSSYPETFFAAVDKYVPEAIPDVFGDYEPLKLKFDLADLSNLYSLWPRGIFWKRKKPKVFGGMAKASRVRHCMIDFNIDFSVSREADCLSILRECSDVFSVDFSYVHLYTGRNRIDEENLGGLTSFHLKKSLPNIPWLTCYGKPYIELFGREKILSQPVYKVEELSEDLIMCQLTESIADIGQNFDKFDSFRDTVKEHLGIDAFTDLQAPNKQCRVPEFTYNLPDPNGP